MSEIRVWLLIFSLGIDNLCCCEYSDPGAPEMQIRISELYSINTVGSSYRAYYRPIRMHSLPDFGQGGFFLHFRNILLVHFLWNINKKAALSKENVQFFVILVISFPFYYVHQGFF